MEPDVWSSGTGAEDQRSAGRAIFEFREHFRRRPVPGALDAEGNQGTRAAGTDGGGSTLRLIAAQRHTLALCNDEHGLVHRASLCVEFCRLAVSRRIAEL